ncbi:glucose-1-phosphate cytidylyltransferase [Dyadobacter pollutisoli]|uniref:Glucose-1-phosphate cytidylyltransferase n=1 Tax=Dyadobacter pollutisoli TaxID=2910158 RepID=A0A9E8SKF4_9BACT|nr:glucose-1-phosphate cytidylyltransferase [Dyadobacter pollutisoli]WAC11928.1 glucose-1-phosphate cytidylyltransferase [Dyadobacter pollutisoli]
MKVVLLAGGLGTRLSEETVLRPKPMVEIGGSPILWHIMKIYASHGFNEFVICLGYKGYVIKEYFANYFLHQSDVTFDMKENKMEIHNSQAEPWKVTLVDTGFDTMTGGRVKRVQKYLNNEPFLLTYGDGVGSINIREVVDFHRQNNKFLTVTAVQPSGRFGALNISDNNSVLSFMEKPKGDGAWINGGFFVCQPQILDYISDDSTIFEKEPLENIAADGQMIAYKHSGFWKPMDTLRDKQELENLWDSGEAPWKNW